jgi:hypothetical protein
MKRIPSINEDPEPLHGSFAARAAFSETGERALIANDHSGEEFLQQLCARHGISMNTAIEIQEEMEEYIGIAANRGAQNSQGAALKIAALEKIFVQILKCKNARLAIWAMAYALELDDIIGHQTVAQIGRAADCSRYNVTKLVERFQVALKLPKRRGQKSEEARRKMAVRRRAQLVPALKEK